jgi:hypothetical protein
LRRHSARSARKRGMVNWSSAPSQLHPVLETT